MDAVKLVKQSYARYDWTTRYAILRCISKNKCNKQRQEILRKHFFMKYPSISSACDPDNINWENLSHGHIYRGIMKMINWVIAIVMIILSLLLVILLKQETMRLKKEFNTSIVCPKDSISDTFKQIAWADQQKDA